MTNFQLKLIALITMTIDHIGMILVSHDSVYYMPLRTIGRLSFVIFAFLITEGLLHTRNKQRYIGVLFGFAFLINILAIYLGYYNFSNIFYTLGLGALAIYLINHFSNIILQIVALFAILSCAVALEVDYGAFGVMVIVLIDVSRTITNNVRYIRELVMALSYYLMINIFDKPHIQMFGIFAFLIIMLYNGKRGYYNPKLKYLIYVYYPIHLLVLESIASRV